jgi:hypothetical protein
MACVDRARRAELTKDLPQELAGLRVTRTELGAYLHRDGHRLDSPDGAKLWQTVSHDVFEGGGLALGRSGMYSTSRCDDVAPASCIELDAWICQVSLETLASRLVAAFDKAGAGDSELGADIHFLEARGPSCHAGAACTPAAHYSRRATYDPSLWRRSLDEGSGQCRDDGDCEGANSNSCMAWYLRGGGELLVYIQRARPAFCGCVERRCSWFEQP